MARLMHPTRSNPHNSMFCFDIHRAIQSNFGMAMHSCRSDDVYDARVRDASSKGCFNHGQCILVSNSALKKTRKVRVAADSRGIESQEREYEFRVCLNKSCRRSGALQTLEVLRGLSPPNVVVESCGCLGRCGSGPNLVVLPAEIFVSHCNTASHVARLLELQCGALDYENNLKALALKQQGNTAFEHGNLSSAESFYSEVLLSNYTLSKGH